MKSNLDQQAQTYFVRDQNCISDDCLEYDFIQFELEENLKHFERLGSY